MSNPKRTRKEIREAIKKIKIKRELKQLYNDEQILVILKNERK